MEFYATIDDTRIDTEQLQSLLVIDRLPELCASIDEVLESEGDSGRIYCVWGEFTVHRQEIRKGIRFTLPTCPNSFAWTITNDGDHVTIHSTMHPREHDAEFIETIEVACEDWRAGVTAAIEAV